MSLLTFRTATEADARLIHAITQEAWAAYRHIPGSSSALDETPELIRSMLADGEQMSVLGFLEGEAVLAVRIRLTAHLYFSRLGVRPSYQGRGYARMTLEWMEGFARHHGVTEARCTVRVSMPCNVRLYESVGYRKVDEQSVVKSPEVQLSVWTMAKTF